LTVAAICCMLVIPPPVMAMRSAALVTGASDGIGVTTAKHLAAKGFTVLLHGRNEARLAQAEATVSQFAQTKSGIQPDVYRLPAADLSSVKGCVSLAQKVQQLCDRESDLQLEVLMNNAGVYSEDHVITSDGLELTFAVNVVAPFVITSLLLPQLLAPSLSSTSKARIVIASSISQCGSIRNWDDLTYQTRPYSAHASYSESKLLDAMLTMEMSQRLVDQGLAPTQITCNCLDPGTVNTKMLLAGWGPIGIDVEDALDQTWLCTSDEVEGVTGKYYTYQQERSAARSAYDKTQRQTMWKLLSDLAPEVSQMWEFDWLSSNP